MKSYEYKILLVSKAVQYAAKDLGVSIPKILYLEKSKFPNNYISAMYLREEKSILFNIEWVKQAEIEAI
jgi:hypothetical protein